MNNYIVLLEGPNVHQAITFIQHSIAKGWWKYTQNAIIMSHPNPATYVHGELMKRFPELTKIVVIKLDREAAWNGLPDIGSQWLKNNL